MKRLKKSFAVALSVFMMIGGIDVTKVTAEDGVPEETAETEIQEAAEPDVTEVGSVEITSAEEAVEETEEPAEVIPEEEPAAEETAEALPVETEEPVAEEAEPEQTTVAETASETVNAEEEPVPSRTEYVFEDKDLKVTAVLEDPTAVSDDAELRVAAVTEDSEQYNYDAYMDALNDSAKKDEEYTSENTLLYDVAFILDGNEVELSTGKVNVDFTFKKSDVISNPDDLEVIHMPIAEDAKAETTADSTDITKDDINVETIEEHKTEVTDKTVSFETESFCIFGFKDGKTSEGGMKNDDGSYKVAESNTWNLDFGTQISVRKLMDDLGVAKNFAIYADELDNGSDHLEGNIAVNTFKDSGNQELNKMERLTENNAITEITLNKTVNAASNTDRTFIFRFFDDPETLKNQVGGDVTVTVPAGSTSGSVTLTKADGNAADVFTAITKQPTRDLYVYEIDDNGNPVDEEYLSGNRTSYQTSYTSSEQRSDNPHIILGAESSLSNYIGKIDRTTDSKEVEPVYFGKTGFSTYLGSDRVDSSWQNENDNTRMNYLVIKDANGNDSLILKNYRSSFGEDPNRWIHNISSSEFESATHLNSYLGNGNYLAGISEELAGAQFGSTSGNSTFSVINLKGTSAGLKQDLINLGFREPQNNEAVQKLLAADPKDDEFLLINIDVTGLTDYRLDSKIKIDGEDGDSDGEYARISSNIIFNFVTKDASTQKFSAYTGQVTLNGDVQAGLIFVPAGSVYQQTKLVGSIIANKVTRPESAAEIHQKGAGSNQERSLAISTHNSMLGSLKIEKNVTVNGQTTSDLKADGTYYFEVKNSAGDTVATPSITIKDGKSDTVQINDLPAGTYTVRETGGSNKKAILVGEQTVTVNVTDPSAASIETASFTNNVEQISIPVTKTWEADGHDLPASITYRLYAGDTEVDSRTVTAADEWNAVFEGLDKLDENGAEIVYTVKEDAGDHYRTSVTKDDQGYHFINTYNETTAEIHAHKTLTGRTLREGEFSFTLTPIDHKDTQTEINVNNDSDGNIDFTGLKYNEIGEYHYSLAEEVPEDENAKTPGIDYAKETYLFTVKVTANEDGSLKAEVVYPEGFSAEKLPEFTNTYHAQGTSATFTARKTINGNGNVGTEANRRTFTFELDGVSENTKMADGTAFHEEKSVVGVGTVDFSEIKYDKTGTYTYTIREKAGSDKGYIYSEDIYDVTVEVFEQLDANKLETGELQRTVTYQKRGQSQTSANVIFNNTYQAEDVDTSVEVTKAFADETAFEKAIGKTFSFTMTGISENTGKKSVTKNIEISRDASANKVVFRAADDLEFKSAGEYRYSIKEADLPVTDDYLGFSKDPKSYALIITVSDDGSGKLAVTSQKLLDEKGNEVDAGRTVTFTNTYSTKEVSNSLHVRKYIEGLPANLTSDVPYQFTLTPVNGAPMPENHAQSQTVTHQGAGGVSFDEITYTEPGDFTYQIVEKDLSDQYDYYSFDKTVWRAVVHVSDVKAQLQITSVEYQKQNADGTWTAVTETAEENGETKNTDAAEFTNTYQVHETKASVSITKGFEPGDALAKADGKTFTFVLESDSVNEQKAFKAEKSITINAKNEAANTATFDELSFKPVFEEGESEKVYTYRLYEKDLSGDDLGGFTKDSSIYLIRYHVYAVGDGNLAYTREVLVYAEGEDPTNAKTVEEKTDEIRTLPFVNTYSTTETTQSFQVTKKVSGYPSDGEVSRVFHFTLKGSDQNPDPTYGSAFTKNAFVTIDRNNASGTTASFKNTDNSSVFHFTKEGTYSFTIEEDTSEQYKYPGYTNDDAVYTAEFTVTDVNGKLQAGPVTYKKDGIAADDGAVYTNTYHADEKKTGFAVHKGFHIGDADTDTNKIANGKVFSFHAFGSEKAAGMDYTGSVTIGQDGKETKAWTVSDIPLKEAGTYVWTIKEDDLPDDDAYKGYTKDSSVYRYEVILKDSGSGTFAMSENWYRNDQKISVKDNQVTYHNTYKTTDTKYQPSAEKTVAGLPAKASVQQTFEFKLTGISDNTKNADGTDYTETVSVRGAGSVNFSEITYTEPGIYQYTIEEIEPDQVPKGYTYDHTVYDLTVVVQDQNSQLVAIPYYEPETPSNADETVETASFVNQYKADETETTLGVTKAFADELAEEYAVGKTFEFELQDTEGNVLETVHTTIGKDETTGELTGTTAQFTKRNYKSAKTENFVIVEKTPTAAGFTKDTAKYEVKIEAVDNGSGKIIVHKYVYRVEEDDTKTQIQDLDPLYVTFTNSYEQQATSYTPSVQKTVKGLPDDAEIQRDFTFNLVGTSENTKDAEGNAYTDSVTAHGAEVKSFNEIPYTAEGVYEYRITEVEPAEADRPAGYTYDSTEWTLKVTVKDVNSELKAVAEYSAADPEGNPITDDHATLVNTYTAADAEDTVSVTKAFDSDLAREYSNGKSFSFTMTGPDDYSDTKTVTVGTTENNTVSFEKISFTKTGTYTYTVSENNLTADEAGFTKDNTIYTVVYDVTDNGSGELHYTRTITAKKGSEETEVEAEDPLTFTFTNSYSETGTSFTPAVTKTVEGLEVTEGTEEQTFEFTLKGEGKNDSVTVKGNGSANFKTIEYDHAGTYTYEIAEVKPDTLPKGYTYDETVWTLTVKVEDIASQLTVTEYAYTADEKDTRSENAAFINTYEAADAEDTVSVTKAFDSDLAREYSNGKSFSFTMTGPDDYSDIKTVTVGTTENNTVSFEKISFTKTGTYTYTVSENNLTADEAGFTKDDTIYTVIYDVTDNGSGELQYTRTVTAKKGSEETEVEAEDPLTFTFTNSYSETGTSFTPAVTKTVEGLEVTEGTEEQTFEFTLKGEGKNDSVTVKGNGSANFKTIEYDHAGTYTYEIAEVKPDTLPKGYTYDETVWTLTVKVEDIASQLTVTEYAYTADEKDACSENAAFVNTYAAAEAEGKIGVVKTFADDLADTKATGRTFGFTLNDEEKKPVETVSVKKNADGTGTEAEFETLSFTKPGTYTYTVSEDDITAEGMGGFTKDSTIHTVVFDVTDNGTGKLNVAKKLDGREVTDALIEVTFENSYSQKGTEVTVPVQKLFKPGCSRKYAYGHTFNFTMVSTSDNLKVNGQNREYHAAVLIDPELDSWFTEFAPLSFSREGIYTYEITEDDIDRETNPGFIKDNTVYTLKIHVKDVDGKLTAEKKLLAGKEDAENVEFTNTYTELLYNKYNSDDELLAGSTFDLVDITNPLKDTVLDEWTSTASEPHDISTFLSVGRKYEIREIAAPEGYALNEPIDFKVNADGTFTGLDDVSRVPEHTHVLKYIDAKLDVEVSKKDAETGKDLAGAELAVVDLKGNVVENWISDGTAHRCENLVEGETYVLHEVKAPAGYATSENITFTVEDTDALQTVTMTDAKLDVEFAKIADDTKEQLVGAKMQLLDAEGNVIDEWTTDEEAHVFTGLTAGAEYTVHEVEAPNGYKLAEDVTFTVEDTADQQTVSMTDAKIIINVEISKISSKTKKPLAGAVLQIRDMEGKVVEEWTSSEEVHKTNGLKADTTYILHEVSAPNGYKLAADIEFTLKNIESVQTVVMVDEMKPMPVPDTSEDKPKKPGIPDTGDHSNVGSLALMFFAALTAAGVALKKILGYRK